jgi:hypothetical protein
MDYNEDEVQEFIISIDTSVGRVNATIPEVTETWGELLDTFYGMLQTLGYSFSENVQKKFEDLIAIGNNEKVINDEDD